MQTRRFISYLSHLRATGVAAGFLAIGAIGTIGIAGAPSAGAVPGCGPAGHAVTVAYQQPHEHAVATLRDYLKTHPQQYNDLRGFLAPIGQRQCAVTPAPPVGA